MDDLRDESPRMDDLDERLSKEMDDRGNEWVKRWMKGEWRKDEPRNVCTREMDESREWMKGEWRSDEPENGWLKEMDEPGKLVTGKMDDSREWMKGEWKRRKWMTWKNVLVKKWMTREMDGLEEWVSEEVDDQGNGWMRGNICLGKWMAQENGWMVNEEWMNQERMT